MLNIYNCLINHAEEEIALSLDTVIDDNFEEYIESLGYENKALDVYGYSLFDIKTKQYISWQDLNMANGCFLAKDKLILVIETRKNTKSLSFGIEIEGNGIESIDTLKYKFQNCELDENWEIKEDASIISQQPNNIWNGEYEYDSKGREKAKILIAGDDGFEMATRGGFCIEWFNKENLTKALKLVHTCRHELRKPMSSSFYQCGLHVHVGNIDKACLLKIAKYAILKENEVWEKYGPGPKREVYCHKFLAGVEAGYKTEIALTQRYCIRNIWLNFRSLEEHDTLEFRIFDGTLDVDTIISRVNFCKEFIEEAIASDDDIVITQEIVKEERCLNVYPVDTVNEKIYIFAPALYKNKSLEEHLEYLQDIGMAIQIKQFNIVEKKDLFAQDNPIKFDKNVINSCLLSINGLDTILVEFMSGDRDIPKEFLTKGDIDEQLETSLNSDLRIFKVVNVQDDTIIVDTNDMSEMHNETRRRYLQRHRWQKDNITTHPSLCDTRVLGVHGFRLSLDSFLVITLNGSKLLVAQWR
jgi:hypothetical protein